MTFILLALTWFCLLAAVLLLLSACGFSTMRCTPSGELQMQLAELGQSKDAQLSCSNFNASQKY